MYLRKIKLSFLAALSLSSADVKAQPLPNAGFEEGSENAPEGWRALGSAKSNWTDEERHEGKRSVSVSDAGTDSFSGWATDLKVEKDLAYSLGGWVKTGGLSPYGPVIGGVICFQFLDQEDQPLGEPITSTPVAENTKWTQVSTGKAVPPAGAAKIRVLVGLQFCKGTAWFDDIELTSEKAAAQKIARISRPAPKPSDGVQFAKSLLANGTIEEGDGGQLRGWKYVGEADKNWTPQEIADFHRLGRPSYAIGRGKGEWSHDVVYAGKGALLNISIDPPLSKNMQWYGRSPVNGYWLSDPMSCQPGKSYLAGGWVRFSSRPGEAWLGPLELQFFDAKGNQLQPVNGPVRPGTRNARNGTWIYWATLPAVAPTGATSMKLRFGHELSADRGGWGRTMADNLAVWEVPDGAAPIRIQEYFFSGPAFWKWFRQAHGKVKPPYLPSPTEADAYPSCMGWIVNRLPGNVFQDPGAKIPIEIAVSNQLGETRKVSIQLRRYDWLGDEDAKIEVPPFEIKGGNDGAMTVTLPPTKRYGAFYLEGEIFEEEALVGEIAGRYAVLPKLERPRSVENIWGVTTLYPFFGDGRDNERELGELLKLAGFGLSWINLTDYLETPKFGKSKKEVDWYNSLGIRPVLRINGFPLKRPLDLAGLEAMGRDIATEFKGRIAAYGNWGVEQANHRTLQAPVFRPILNGQMLTDEEYDQILVAFYQGIKSVDQETPVLIGNIAGDTEARTVQRLYKEPVAGRFDGAITNAYMAILPMAQNCLKVFDEHGDTHKTIWQEETALQSSPAEGPERRRSEGEGARNLVRVWLSMKAELGPRLRAMTMWGFVAVEGGGHDGISMVSSDLQPRPQFSAHAVMADALADAVFVANHSEGNVSIFEWKRGDGPLFTIWANSGERSVTFDVPDETLSSMDLMGNQTKLAATAGVVSIKVTPSPIYVFGGGALTLSKRLETCLEHGSTEAGRPVVRLTLRNHGKELVEGTAKFAGPIEGKLDWEFQVPAKGSKTLAVPVQPKLREGDRDTFAAECTTKQGAVYFATAGLNFAHAVRVAATPAMDGTWTGWEKAPWISFGDKEGQIALPYNQPDEKYDGPQDVSGKFRLLWDDQYLYIGVASRDDASVTQPERGMLGFMGDSIEFAVQPQNLLSQRAPYWEFEFYKPSGSSEPAASRRFPLPGQMMQGWRGSVTSTGEKGDVNYQVAVPWRDLGVDAPNVGKVISFALVLNDDDQGEYLNGGRARVRWFEGVDLKKNPEKFGDVTLVNPGN